ncbi:MAG: hypothetical protein K8L99_30200 [Anaerolineae bacterium]|nr:hypothetical protein [Anaerolineae bacterium]
MSNGPSQPPNDQPDWLDPFEQLANEQLDRGSSCDQVHPIVANWFDKLMDGAPPESRDSVLQANSCLATEVLFSSPEYLIESMLERASEDEIATWIEQILMIGRAFEISLRSGELDDL